MRQLGGDGREASRPIVVLQYHVVDGAYATIILDRAYSIAYSGSMNANQIHLAEVMIN